MRPYCLDSGGIRQFPVYLVHLSGGKRGLRFWEFLGAQRAFRIRTSREMNEAPRMWLFEEPLFLLQLLADAVNTVSQPETQTENGWLHQTRPLKDDKTFFEQF